MIVRFCTIFLENHGIQTAVPGRTNSRLADSAIVSLRQGLIDVSKQNIYANGAPVVAYYLYAYCTAPFPPNTHFQHCFGRRSLLSLLCHSNCQPSFSKLKKHTLRTSHIHTRQPLCCYRHDGKVVFLNVDSINFCTTLKQRFLTSSLVPMT